MTQLILISLVLTSCNIFGTEDSTGVQIKLSPETVSLNENPNLRIENLTDSRVRLTCGYSIEVLQNGDWQHHNGLGCLSSAPSRTIKAREVYTREISLFAKSPGTYRIVLDFAILENEEWVGETYRTNSVKVK
jgi:hypothetical protein